MNNSHVGVWTGVLLAAGLCYSAGSAFAHDPEPNASATQNAQTRTQQVTNPVLSRRQAATDELAIATYARMQVDPRFRAFVQHVNNYNAAMAEYVKARTGGVK